MSKFPVKLIEKELPKIIQRTQNLLKGSSLYSLLKGKSKEFESALETITKVGAKPSFKRNYEFPEIDANYGPVANTKDLVDQFSKDYKSIVEVPFRSNNKDIKIVSDYVNTGSNAIKEYLGSKQYHKMIKRANQALKKYGFPEISEKELRETFNTALDARKVLVGKQNLSNIEGQSAPGVVILNGVKKNKYTPFHELIHLAQQWGGLNKKGKGFTEGMAETGSNQNSVGMWNQYLINQIENRLPKSSNALFRDERNRLLDVRELQAEIQPLQIMMHQHGWQPKQMNHIINNKTSNEARGLHNIDAIKKLYQMFGSENMEFLLTNMLKKGGKIDDAPIRYKTNTLR